MGHTLIVFCEHTIVVINANENKMHIKWSIYIWTQFVILAVHQYIFKLHVHTLCFSLMFTCKFEELQHLKKISPRIYLNLNVRLLLAHSQRLDKSCFRSPQTVFTL